MSTTSRNLEETSMNEPLKMHSRIIDKNGDTWVRGRRWWAREYGATLSSLNNRRQTVGRLSWDDLNRMYGPLGPAA